MTPSAGAMRAAKALSTLATEPHTLDNTTCPQCLKVAEVIDRETHAAELLRACKSIAAMAVAWHPLTPGDIAEVHAAIAKAEGQ